MQKKTQNTDYSILASEAEQLEAAGLPREALSLLSLHASDVSGDNLTDLHYRSAMLAYALQDFSLAARFFEHGLPHSLSPESRARAEIARIDTYSRITRGEKAWDCCQSLLNLAASGQLSRPVLGSIIRELGPIVKRLWAEDSTMQTRYPDATALFNLWFSDEMSQ